MRYLVDEKWTIYGFILLFWFCFGDELKLPDEIKWKNDETRKEMEGHRKTERDRERDAYIGHKMLGEKGSALSLQGW